MKKLKAAIIGLGFIGESHIEAIHRIGICELYAVFSNNRKKAHERAEFYKDNVIPIMNVLRTLVDEMETLTAAEYWPLPSYGDLLFCV